MDVSMLSQLKKLKNDLFGDLAQDGADTAESLQNAAEDLGDRMGIKQRYDYVKSWLKEAKNDSRDFAERVAAKTMRQVEGAQAKMFKELDPFWNGDEEGGGLRSQVFSETEEGLRAEAAQHLAQHSGASNDDDAAGAVGSAAAAAVAGGFAGKATGVIEDQGTVAPEKGMAWEKKVGTPLFGKRYSSGVGNTLRGANQKADQWGVTGAATGAVKTTANAPMYSQAMLNHSETKKYGGMLGGMTDRKFGGPAYGEEAPPRTPEELEYNVQESPEMKALERAVSPENFQKIRAQMSDAVAIRKRKFVPVVPLYSREFGFGRWVARLDSLAASCVSGSCRSGSRGLNSGTPSRSFLPAPNILSEFLR